MSLQVPALGASGAQGLDVTEAIFGQPYNETLVHQLVVKYMAAARAGTKAQKTRSDVSGGGIKPWRQKGTGNARAGTTRSPIWRTGGVVFAARPRNYEQKLNKKMFRSAIRSILSELLRQERLVVSNDLSLEAPKTKLLVEKLKAVAGRKIVLVVDAVDANLALAARNIPYVHVVTAANLNPVLLVSSDKVIVTPSALKQVQENLA